MSEKDGPEVIHVTHNHEEERPLRILEGVVASYSLLCRRSTDLAFAADPVSQSQGSKFLQREAGNLAVVLQFARKVKSSRNSTLE